MRDWKLKVSKMMLEHNKKLTPNAQKLRKEMTAEERQLWYLFLRRIPLTVNRQRMIGNYIVDFYCHEAKLAIELDGSQHYESSGVAYDSKRDEYLKSCGLMVLRYSNRDIHERFKAVCSHILSAMEERTGQEIILKE